MIKPMHEKVLVQPTVISEKSKGGIYLPVGYEEKTSFAEIKAISEEIENPEFKVGDTIIYDKFAGYNIIVEKIEMLILNKDDIIAVIEAEDK